MRNTPLSQKLSATWEVMPFVGDEMTRADLSEAVLNGTDFSRAILIEADLTDANLMVADITQKQLEQAGSLEGAIMPNGSAYLQEGP